MEERLRSGRLGRLKPYPEIAPPDHGRSSNREGERDLDRSVRDAGIAATEG